MTATNLHLRASPPFLHRLLAAGGVALVLLLSVLAASPGLHAWLHSNAGETDHECVITLYQHGVVAAAAEVVLVVVARVLLARVPQAPAELRLSPPRYWLYPGRAPPAC
ncbi:MAG: hypothetical protein ABSC03_19755 [Verrucomicrobiota bacterium]|jgi:hypothetical protein